MGGAAVGAGVAVGTGVVVGDAVGTGWDVGADVETLVLQAERRVAAINAGIVARVILISLHMTTCNRFRLGPFLSTERFGARLRR